MPRFEVGLREVHVSTRVVEAETAEEALNLVLGGEGEEVSCEYSHTLDEGHTVEVKDA